MLRICVLPAALPALGGCATYDAATCFLELGSLPLCFLAGDCVPCEELAERL